VLYSLQKPEARWKRLIRYFDSRDRSFTASNAAELLREGGVGWLYHLTHGEGYYIAGSRVSPKQGNLGLSTGGSPTADFPVRRL